MIGVARVHRPSAVIAVRLEHLDFISIEAVLAAVDLVGLDLVGVGPDAVEAGVDVREVRGVDEVLDGPKSVGAIVVWPRLELAERRIVPLEKGRHVVIRIAQRHPNPIVFFFDAMDECAGLLGRRLVRMGRHQRTRPLAVIAPAVIGADDLAVLDPSHGEPGAAVDAQVLPGHHPALVSPHDEVLAEEAHLHDLAFTHVLGARHHVPVVDQKGIPVRLVLSRFRGLRLRTHGLSPFGLRNTSNCPKAPQLAARKSGGGALAPTRRPSLPSSVAIWCAPAPPPWRCGKEVP